VWSVTFGKKSSESASVTVKSLQSSVRETTEEEKGENCEVDLESIRAQWKGNDSERESSARPDYIERKNRGLRMAFRRGGSDFEAAEFIGLFGQFTTPVSEGRIDHAFTF
jgi:hypothetical protein